MLSRPGPEVSFVGSILDVSDKSPVGANNGPVEPALAVLVCLQFVPEWISKGDFHFTASFGRSFLIIGEPSRFVKCHCNNIDYIRTYLLTMRERSRIIRA